MGAPARVAARRSSVVRAAPTAPGSKVRCLWLGFCARSSRAARKPRSGRRFRAAEQNRRRPPSSPARLPSRFAHRFRHRCATKGTIGAQCRAAGALAESRVSGSVGCGAWDDRSGERSAERPARTERVAMWFRVDRRVAFGVLRRGRVRECVGALRIAPRACPARPHVCPGSPGCLPGAIPDRSHSSPPPHERSLAGLSLVVFGPVCLSVGRLVVDRHPCSVYRSSLTFAFVVVVVVAVGITFPPIPFVFFVSVFFRLSSPFVAFSLFFPPRVLWVPPLPLPFPLSMVAVSSFGSQGFEPAGDFEADEQGCCGHW